MSEGIAAVKSKEGFGYMDVSGNLLVFPQFNWAGSFCEGRAVVAGRDAGTA